MKLIYRASDINEANIVSGMLHANDIDAHVGGYYLQGGIGELAAFGFANVHVPDEDVEKARILIAQYEDASNSYDEADTDEGHIRFYISVILFALILVMIFYYFTNKG